MSETKELSSYISYISNNLDKINLSTPKDTSKTDGFSKYKTQLSFEGKPLTIVLPQCNTKQGIVSTSQRTYVDLEFNENDCEPVMDLINMLENRCSEIMFEKSALWFSTPNLTLNDFSAMLSTLIRYNKRNKVLTLRVFIPTSARNIRTRSLFDLYDENGDPLPNGIKDWTADRIVTPLITVSDVSFTPSNFNIVMTLKECMLMDNIAKPKSLLSHSKPSISLSPPTVSTDQTAQENHEIEVNTQSSIDNPIENSSSETIVQDNQIDRKDNCVNETIEQTIENDPIDNSIDYQTTQTIDNTDDQSVSEPPKEFQEFSDVKEDGPDNQQEDVNEESDDEINQDNIKFEGIEDCELEEISSLDTHDLETIHLKKHNDVYRDIYKAAINKAKKLRQTALQAYLDAKRIKAKFMLDDFDDSDDEFEEEESW